jgi:hypothetical protein
MSQVLIHQSREVREKAVHTTSLATSHIYLYMLIAHVANFTQGAERGVDAMSHIAISKS